MKFLGDFERSLLQKIGPECRGLFWFVSHDERSHKQDLTPLIDYLLDDISVFEQAHLGPHHLFFGKSFDRPFFILKLSGDFDQYKDFLRKNHQVFEQSLEWGASEQEFVGMLGRSVDQNEMQALKKVLPKSQLKWLM